MRIKLCKGIIEVELSGDMRDCKLRVRGEVLKPTSVRRLKEVVGVMLRINMRENERPLYYMFRGVNVAEEQAKIMSEHNLRHDITVILPGSVGAENVRTHGHYHPIQDSIGYGEVYQVYHGEAVFLLQERRGWGEVGRVAVIYAKRGDAVYIPPTYGHVTYNWGEEPLILGNLVYGGFRSDYEEYRELKGPAYYLLSDGTLIPNPKYRVCGSLSFMPERLRFKVKGCIFRDVTRRKKLYVNLLIVDMTK